MHSRQRRARGSWHRCARPPGVRPCGAAAPRPAADAGRARCSGPPPPPRRSPRPLPAPQDALCASEFRAQAEEAGVAARNLEARRAALAAAPGAAAERAGIEVRIKAVSERAAHTHAARIRRLRPALRAKRGLLGGAADAACRPLPRAPAGSRLLGLLLAGLQPILLARCARLRRRLGGPRRGPAARWRRSCAFAASSRRPTGVRRGQAAAARLAGRMLACRPACWQLLGAAGRCCLPPSAAAGAMDGTPARPPTTCLAWLPPPVRRPHPRHARRGPGADGTGRGAEQGGRQRRPHPAVSLWLRQHRPRCAAQNALAWPAGTPRGLFLRALVRSELRRRCPSSAGTAPLVPPHSLHPAPRTAARSHPGAGPARRPCC